MILNLLDKISFQNYLSCININYLLFSVCLSLYLVFFSSIKGNDIIQNVKAQINMDSFSAKGIIFTRLAQSHLINVQELNNSQAANDVTNNSNTNTIPPPTPNQNLPFLDRQWELLVLKGEVNSFHVIFSLVDNNDKIVNAFAIYNLESNRYVQLNDKGTEIISGTVDFSSK